MMASCVPLLFALLQTPGTAPAEPQVGDTVWITRVAKVPAGGAVRPAAWAPMGDLELLGPAVVLSYGDSVEIRYPAVAWRAGTHNVDVPGPLLLLAGGGVDSLPPLRLTLEIGSVLPRGVPDSALRPQPPAEVVRRSERSGRPMLLLAVLAVVVVIPLHLRWRRRGDPPPRTKPSAPKSPPVERWAGAGEGRAALAAANAILRDTIAARVPEAPAALETAACLAAVRSARPDWPFEELERVLRAIDDARFQPGALPQAADLAGQALALRTRLTGMAA